VTPRLNGLKYFEKPPLQYWATAAFFRIFGLSDAVARLWTALACLGGIVLVWRAGTVLYGPPAGRLAAMILAGSPLYVLLGQINTLDMALTFFLSGAVLAFALGRYYLFWTACAAAVLSKGLIGIVLPLGTIGLYILMKWEWGLLRRMKILSGGALFLALCAPWFIAVSMANPEFAHFFFVQEHFQRFTSKIHGRYQPLWYFVPILAFGIAPWILPFVFSFQKNPRKDRTADFDTTLFLALWALVVFAFFSVSGSKLPSYILPMFPAVALLTARWVAAAQPRRLLAAQAALAALAGIVLAAAARWILEKMDAPPELASLYVPWLVGAGALLAGAATSAGVAAWRGKIVPAVALLALGSFGCSLTALIGHRTLAPAYSIASQADRVTDPAPVFAVDFYDHTLTMVGYKDELAQAITWELRQSGEPQKFIPDLAGFARAWAASPAAYAVFSSADFENLKKEINVPMEIVSRGPRYIIVRKP
jgi:4-amino-4-deoxy-L-arabinose transferase-like glycosyltransferase